MNSTDESVCVDIDECNPPGLCDQHCENLDGSFDARVMLRIFSILINAIARL